MYLERCILLGAREAIGSGGASHTRRSDDRAQKPGSGFPVDLVRGRAPQTGYFRFVADPITRSSFRNVFGYTLAAMAQLR